MGVSRRPSSREPGTCSKSIQTGGRRGSRVGAVSIGTSIRNDNLPAGRAQSYPFCWRCRLLRMDGVVQTLRIERCCRRMPPFKAGSKGSSRGDTLLVERCWLCGCRVRSDGWGRAVAVRSTGATDGNDRLKPSLQRKAATAPLVSRAVLIWGVGVTSPICIGRHLRHLRRVDESARLGLLGGGSGG